MSEYIKICEDAARAGGEVLLEWQGRIHAKEKGPRDLVTEADVASQVAIREVLLGAFPSHEFVGEEDCTDEAKLISTAGSEKSGYRWIVDPLDGTTNYVHQFPSFAVSIALEHDGEIVVGAVYDPVLDHCYLAEAGKGASLNGNRLKVSSCKDLGQSLLAVSFSANVTRGSKEIDRFIEILQCCRALRRLGSCALNLCYLAAGQLDGYFATSVKSWDVAAGVLIVNESGGTVTNIDGGPFDLRNPKFAAAATDSLQKQLVSVLKLV